MLFWQAYDFKKLVYCEALCVVLYITENSFNSSIDNYFNAVYFLNLVHFLTACILWIFLAFERISSVVLLCCSEGICLCYRN